MMRLFHRSDQSGFTLIELLIVIVIIGALFTLSTINLGQATTTASIGSVTDKLVTDLKAQQLLAMSGGGTTNQQPHGIHIEAGQYTLFESTFVVSDPANLTVDLPDNTTLGTNLPSNQVLFTKGEGEVSSFDGSFNTITITSSTDSKTITINRFGVVSVE